MRKIRLRKLYNLLKIILLIKKSAKWKPGTFYSSPCAHTLLLNIGLIGWSQGNKRRSVYSNIKNKCILTFLSKDCILHESRSVVIWLF